VDAATYPPTYRGTFRDGITIDDAARRLGVSPSTVRRWVKAGRVKSERVVRPQGYVVLVELPARAPSTPPVEHAPQIATELPTAEGSAVERADTMAAYLATYAAKVVEPHLATIREQAEEIGRLKAELEHIRRSRAPESAPPAEAGSRPSTGLWARLAGWLGGVGS
jgi:excisionase family DNA binding protein